MLYNIFRFVIINIIQFVEVVSQEEKVLVGDVSNSLLDEFEEVEHELVLFLEESLIWIGIIVVLLVVLPNICNCSTKNLTGDRKED